MQIDKESVFAILTRLVYTESRIEKRQSERDIHRSRTGNPTALCKGSDDIGRTIWMHRADNLPESSARFCVFHLVELFVSLGETFVLCWWNSSFMLRKYWNPFGKQARTKGERRMTERTPPHFHQKEYWLF